MTDEEKLRDIVRKAAAFSLPSNTQEFHLDMFTNSLMASGVKIGKDTNVPRWIPVTERLPEKNGKYLCIYYFGETKDIKFTSMLDYYATDKEPHFQHTLCNPEMKVTHWMPLPTPPKDGE